MSDSAPSVARTLVRLKLRLLLNRARSSNRGRIQLAVALILALAVGSAGALTAFALASSGARTSRVAIVVGASALALGWTLLPLLSFGSDESLDPTRLVLFPLRRGPLMRGLLLSSFVGPAPTAVLLVVVGATIGYSRDGGVVIIVAAMVLLLLLSAATARTVSTFLAAGLTSRRGRDATIIIVSLVALSAQGLRFVRLSAIDPAVVDRGVAILRWTPPGMLGQAVIDARDGRLLIAALELVPPAVLIPLLLAWWARALDRSVTVVVDGQTSRRRHGIGATLPLLFPRLPFLSRGPWGAVAAKELRYVGREPRRKVTLLNSLLIGVGVPVWVAVRSSGNIGQRSVLLATLAGYVAVLGSSNQFGLDGGAVWLDIVAGDTMKSVLMGKNLAMALEVLPVVAVVGTLVAALTGGWLYLPAALVLAVAGLGAGLALANVTSVRFPIPLPESRSPFAGGGGGQGCATGAILFGCLIAQNLLLAPVVLATIAAVTIGPGWLIVSVPLSALYGITLWWGGLTIATGYGRAHLPELLATVDPGRSA